MSDVTVTINRRAYQIACDEGQEDHLRQLAQIVDKRVEELVTAMGQIGDQRLLVMASLLLADEVADLRGQLDETESKNRSLQADAPHEEASISALEALAARIETLAASLERDGISADR